LRVESICIANIGPRERRRRLRGGFVALAFAALGVVLLWTTGASRGWRALLFVPLLFAALGLLQVRAKTCVALAAQGMRNLDAGNERIDDPAELQAVKAQARRVNIQALLVAAAVTAALLAAP
jgi:hypothetical protein